MNKHTEAIIFFNALGICKEMLMPEFEAILDGVVCLDELQGQAVKCAYVQIDEHLQIIAIVLFLLDFDQEGMADRQWNIPFKNLLSTAGQGPNWGAGPIKLVTQTVCTNDTYYASLWDSGTIESADELLLIKEAIKRNRLRIQGQKTATKKEVAPQERTGDQNILKIKQQIAQLKQLFNDELKRYQQALNKAKQANEELVSQNQALSMRLETQKQQFEDRNDYLTQLLKNAERKNRAELSIMQRQIELRRKVQTYPSKVSNTPAF
ncbi:hypothetical protein [Zooshikella ganghwensis]|uniref:hypothetical protein n=1 Tax=Zooshikella ganghwensis TaxID=202772 RepID=UPI00040C0DF5|nr:hypothetical protein [Zooshikella ganghwensis]